MEQELAQLAMQAGQTVVTAAATEGWAAFRGRLARWFGRGAESRERVALERLDRPEEREAGRWELRIVDALEELEPAERAAAAAELRELLGSVPAAAGGGIAAGRDITIRAEGAGSVAAGTVHGNVSTGGTAPADPSGPDAPRG